MLHVWMSMPRRLWVRVCRMRVGLWVQVAVRARRRDRVRRGARAWPWNRMTSACGCLLVGLLSMRVTTHWGMMIGMIGVERRHRRTRRCGRRTWQVGIRIVAGAGDRAVVRLSGDAPLGSGVERATRRRPQLPHILRYMPSLTWWGVAKCHQLVIICKPTTATRPTCRHPWHSCHSSMEAAAVRMSRCRQLLQLSLV